MTLLSKPEPTGIKSGYALAEKTLWQDPAIT
jgi:hypothetical protein